jgi:hypothetical protein
MMNVPNQRKNSHSSILGSQKKRFQALMVERGSVTSIQMSLTEFDRERRLTEQAIFVLRQSDEISPWCFLDSTTQRDVCFESNLRLPVIGESSFANAQIRYFFFSGIVYQIGHNCFALCAN